MNKVFKLLSLILITILFFSCSNNTVQTGTVKLSAQKSNSKTLMPNTVQAVSSYDYELKSQFKTYKGTSTEPTIKFDKVLVGNYTININGKDNKGTVTQKGGSDVKVTPGAVSNVSVQLFMIDDDINAKGAISVPINWSAVINEYNFSEGLKAGLKVELVIDGKPFEQTQIVQDNETHSTTLTFDNIPVSKAEKSIYFNIYNSSNNLLLVRRFFDTKAIIRGGQVSTPDSNEFNSGKILLNNIVTADNIYNIQFTPLANATDVIWSNPQKNGKNLAKTVILTYQADGEMPQSIKVEQDETMLKGKATITGLSSTKKYSLTYSAISFNGAESPKKDHYLKFSPLIFIEDLIVDETNLPQGNINTGHTFTLSANVVPAEGTNSEVIWSCTPSDVFKIQGNTFTATRPGSATISATTIGTTAAGLTITKTVSRPVNIVLSTPSISAIIGTDGIAISWSESVGATGYNLYEIVDGGQAALLATLSDKEHSYLKNTDIIAGSSYQYYVQALYAQDPSANSANSNTTDKIIPVIPNIEILPPVLQEEFKIEFAQKDPNLIISGVHNAITFKMPEIATIKTYEWYINGILVKNGDYLAANSLTIEANTPGVYTDASYTLNSLVIKLIDNKDQVYSATVQFEVVDVLDTGVEVYIEGDPSAKHYIPTTKNSFSLTYRVLPENASNTNLLFETSDPSVATVSPRGVVTIKNVGDVTITVKPLHGKAEKLNFKFYKPTFNSRLELLNAINAVVNKELTAADTHYGGDWWQLSANPYKNNGITIQRTTAAGGYPESGFMKAENFKTSSQAGDIILNTKTDIILGIYNPGGLGETGHMGTDNLQTIGAVDPKMPNQGELIVTLPYCQGSVSIVYDSVNVLGAERKGNYRMEFLPIVVDETHSYKLFPDEGPIADSDQVTRLFNKTN